MTDTKELDELIFAVGSFTTDEQQTKDTANLKAYISKHYISKEAVERATGQPIPADQPFDDELDIAELIGNKLFRKGAEWKRQQIRKELGL